MDVGYLSATHLTLIVLVRVCGIVHLKRYPLAIVLPSMLTLKNKGTHD